MPELNNPTPTPGGEGEGAGTGEPQGGQQPQATPATPTEYEIDGQKYSADQIREAFKSMKDYQAFVPEFTRKSQVLAELKKAGLIDDQGNPVQKKNEEQPAGGDQDLLQNPQAKEVVKILKQLGFITKEEAETLKKEIDTFRSSYQQQIDEQKLDEVSKTLAAKYDGKKGEPKFDLEEIRQAVAKDASLVRYIPDPQNEGNYLVDLEATYRNVHADFWNKIPDLHGKVPKTERGAGPQGTTPSRNKKPETEEEKIADAVDFFKNSKVDE